MNDFWTISKYLTSEELYDRSHGPAFVYTLSDPNDLTVRYVGVTGCPKSRFDLHVNIVTSRKNDPKENWIVSLRKKGQKPVMSIIVQCPFSKRFDYELFCYTILSQKGTLYQKPPVRKRIELPFVSAEQKKLLKSK